MAPERLRRWMPVRWQTVPLNLPAVLESTSLLHARCEKSAGYYEGKLRPRRVRFSPAVGNHTDTTRRGTGLRQATSLIFTSGVSLSFPAVCKPLKPGVISSRNLTANVYDNDTAIESA